MLTNNKIAFPLPHVFHLGQGIIQYLGKWYLKVLTDFKERKRKKHGL